MTIRRRFILVFALFSIALGAIFGWLSYGIARNSLEAQLDQLLRQTAGAAVTGIQAAIVLALEPGYEDLDGFSSTVARLNRLRVGGYARGAWVFDQRGNTALATHAGDSIPIGTTLRFFEPYADEISLAMQSGESTTPLFQGVDGGLYKYGFRQIDGSDAILAVLIPADFLEPLARLRNLLLIGTLIGLAVAAWLAAALAGGIARPLEALSRAALRIQRGHMETPVGTIEREDELGQLADAMERMRVGIVTRDEQLRLMLAQVAHEIRNPLGGLELFASAASDTEDPEERRSIMQRIRGEVGALNRIIEEFLTFARPTAVELERVDLRQSIEAAVFLAGDNGDRIEVELPSESLVARCDPDQMKRVVLNLIRNALHVADRVRIRAEVLRGEVVLTVADNGPGVSEELRGRIFEPFVTDKEQGAGLGLAIVRRVAEAHGGRVELGEGPEPPFESGATFRVYLPGLEHWIAGDRDPAARTLSRGRE